MRLSRFRPRFTVHWLMIAVGLAGLALVLDLWMVRRAETLRVETANRALARKQLALIDETWADLELRAHYGRVDIDGGTFGPWGRRKLEALRNAGAGKAEIIAALEKYINDLGRMRAIARAQENKGTVRVSTSGEDEIRFLQLEAEIWLNEEKAR
jgi:hypothetical protein